MLFRSYFETAIRSVVEADSRFGSVDLTAFCNEIVLIRIELFALAWLHQLGDKHIAAQSAFTKRYLELHTQSFMWDALEPYNQAIARSSTLAQSSDKAVGRAYLTLRNKIVADFFDQWCSKGVDPKVVARAANRLSTEVAWSRGITSGLLLHTLCSQLGCELNEEAQVRLVAVIRGLYDGARKTMKGIVVDADSPAL